MDANKFLSGLHFHKKNSLKILTWEKAQKFILRNEHVKIALIRGFRDIPDCELILYSESISEIERDSGGTVLIGFAKEVVEKLFF